MKAILLILALVSVLPALAETDAVAHPDQKFAAGKTVVWSPLFQASWDALNELHGGKPVKIEPPNQLIAKLDAFSWDATKTMPDSGWKVWSGLATQEFVAQANREAAVMTGEKADAFTLQDMPPGWVLVLGLLKREVSFEKALFRSQGSGMEFKAGDAATPVHFFGVKGEASEDFSMIRVLAYRPGEKCHALQLPCSGGKDSVVLYRPPAVQDFATACTWLRTWMKQWEPGPGSSLSYKDPHLHLNDEIKVPYLDLVAERDFRKELSSARYYRENPVPWRIAMARQKAEFELHEKGARVRVKVEIVAGPLGGGSEEPKSFPRIFAYDAPFFVFLWKEGAEWPYFGAWIGDASAMKKWE
ncbi:hypothetical protein [Haloferula sp. BvORR071]|uniref:hypothetical protein n=1 Tax=Haloferula sp. BvORR071 TaxID=1396141 RepID=UPI000555E759|nr:hypothetical protein [Haloferula sp. BvORR071]